MTTQADQHDHVDRFLETIHLVLPELDLEVEGIVDRFGGIARRLNRTMDETVAEFGLDNVEHKALSVLTQSGPPFRSTPGKLARLRPWYRQYAKLVPAHNQSLYDLPSPEVIIHYELHRALAGIKNYTIKGDRT